MDPLIFRPHTYQQARYQDMTLNYKAQQQESNGKINWEHQNYLPSNTHLEGKLSSKYYLRFVGSFNEKWQGFSMVCSESEFRLVELLTFPD